MKLCSTAKMNSANSMGLKALSSQSSAQKRLSGLTIVASSVSAKPMPPMVTSTCR